MHLAAFAFGRVVSQWMHRGEVVLPSPLRLKKTGNPQRGQISLLGTTWLALVTTNVAKRMRLDVRTGLFIHRMVICMTGGKLLLLEFHFLVDR
jgi:hypothetical protein